MTSSIPLCLLADEVYEQTAKLLHDICEHDRVICQPNRTQNGFRQNIERRKSVDNHHEHILDPRVGHEVSETILSEQHRGMSQEGGNLSEGSNHLCYV